MLVFVRSFIFMISEYFMKMKCYFFECFVLFWGDIILRVKVVNCSCICNFIVYVKIFRKYYNFFIIEILCIWFEVRKRVIFNFVFYKNFFVVKVIYIYYKILEILEGYKD